MGVWHLDAEPWCRWLWDEIAGGEGLGGGIGRSGGGAGIRWGSRGEELERGGGNGFMDGESAWQIARRRHCSRRRKECDAWPGEMDDWTKGKKVIALFS